MSDYQCIQEIGKSLEVIDEITKFNPYHDKLGRFSTATGATSFTYKPGAGAMYDNAIEREKKRMQEADSAASTLRPRKGLADGLGEEHAMAVEELVNKNAPEAVKKLWAEYGDRIGVKSTNVKRGSCSPDCEIKVNLDVDSSGTRKDPYSTTAHECGHALDRLVGMTKGYNIEGEKHEGFGFATVWNDGEFHNTIVNEVKEYTKGVQSRLSSLSSVAGGKKISIGEAREYIGDAMRKDGGFRKWGGVSDIFEGATLGKFNGPGGHGTSYWTGTRRTYGTDVTVEAFAIMTEVSIAGGPALEAMKERLPKSYETYLRMCEDVL